MAPSARKFLASLLGWVIVAVVLFWAFGFVIGWIRFVVRSLGWIVVLAVLVIAYLTLKSPDDADD